MILTQFSPCLKTSPAECALRVAFLPRRSIERALFTQTRLHIYNDSMKHGQYKMKMKCISDKHSFGSSILIRRAHLINYYKVPNRTCRVCVIWDVWITLRRYQIQISTVDRLYRVWFFFFSVFPCKFRGTRRFLDYLMTLDCTGHTVMIEE